MKHLSTLWLQLHTFASQKMRSGNAGPKGAPLDTQEQSKSIPLKFRSKKQQLLRVK